MEEVWKEIPGARGLYHISSKGRVKSLARMTYYTSRGGNPVQRAYPEVIMKLPTCNDTWYPMVTIRGINRKLVHRLVAIAFIPNPDNLEFVNHKDGIKQNNNVENLEWCTRQQNEDHAFRTGLKNSTGCNNAMSKLQDEDVVSILKVSNRCVSVKNDLCKQYDVSRATIERIWNRKIWKHITT